MMRTKTLSIYIHVPFCARKCLYCDFLSFSAGEEVQNRYCEMLLQEIQQNAPTYAEYEVDSVFIGGGTPSLLKPDWIMQIMQTIQDAFHVTADAEISMEINPGTLQEGAAEIYYAAGINRVSIGLQSIHPLELKVLGRIHDFSQFKQSYERLRRAGFTNMNIDLMIGLPGQTMETMLQSVEAVINLKPQHISAYSLIVEEGTVFDRVYGEHKENMQECYPLLYRYALPEEDTERSMYYALREYLQKYGFQQYEISNFALDGYASRHNTGYWTGHNYVGFGLGAASMVSHVRWKNTGNMECYLTGQQEKTEYRRLSREEQMEECCFLGLRLTKGVSCKAFEKQFGVSLFSIYGSWIQKMQTGGLLAQKEDFVFLTEKGMDLANYVMSGFLLD